MIVSSREPGEVVGARVPEVATWSNRVFTRLDVLLEEDQWSVWHQGRQSVSAAGSIPFRGASIQEVENRYLSEGHGPPRGTASIFPAALSGRWCEVLCLLRTPFLRLLFLGDREQDFYHLPGIVCRGQVTCQLLERLRPVKQAHLCPREAFLLREALRHQRAYHLAQRVQRFLLFFQRPLALAFAFFQRPLALAFAFFQRPLALTFFQRSLAFAFFQCPPALLFQRP